MPYSRKRLSFRKRWYYNFRFHRKNKTTESNMMEDVKIDIKEEDIFLESDQCDYVYPSMITAETETESIIKVEIKQEKDDDYEYSELQNHYKSENTENITIKIEDNPLDTNFDNKELVRTIIDENSGECTVGYLDEGQERNTSSVTIKTENVKDLVDSESVPKTQVYNLSAPIITQQLYTPTVICNTSQVDQNMVRPIIYVVQNAPAVAVVPEKPAKPVKTASMETFPCHVCKKRYTTRSGVSLHMRVHNVNEPYACHLCPKRFQHKCHMALHINTMHSKDKEPYKCTMCDLSFLNSDKFCEHIRAHRAKSFTCNVCSKQFCRKWDFSAHMRAHNKPT